MGHILKIRNTHGAWVEVPALKGASAYEAAIKNGFEGTEQEWLESLKGRDGLDGMSFFKSTFLKQYCDTRIALRKGAMYYYECSSSTKTYIYKSDGSLASSVGAIAALLFYPDNSEEQAKLIALKNKPSITTLLDFYGTAVISAKSLDGGYLEAEDGGNVWCWEIGSENNSIQPIGSYTLKALIKGITAELSVSLLYALEFDEFAVFIGDAEITRAAKGGAVRIASEILYASDTRLAFYKDGKELLRAMAKPTAEGCGVLYVGA